MKRGANDRGIVKSVFVFMVILVPAFGPGSLFAQSDSSVLVNAAWKTTTVAQGMVWKAFHFPSLYASRQSVNTLTIDASQSAVSLQFAYVTSGFEKTSAFGASAKAAAAVNGDFFNTTTGGAVIYLKVNGTVINQTASSYTSGTPSLCEAAFVVHASKALTIEKLPASGNWADLTGFASKPDIMANGPLLLFAGALYPQTYPAFDTVRNPRTAVGLIDSTHLVLITVDGRTDSAAGMTTPQLAQTLKYLGCTYALNLDGGGSTTMWVSGQPFSGVVNYPSDNGLYDHAGERSVCNAICIMDSPVHVLNAARPGNTALPSAPALDLFIRGASRNCRTSGQDPLINLQGRTIGMAGAPGPEPASGVAVVRRKSAPEQAETPPSQ